MTQDSIARLEETGKLPDNRINLAKTALILAALDSPGISLDRYENHIIKMSDEVVQRHALLLKEGAEDDAATQLAALKYVMVDIYDYQGDVETYDDLQNANLIRVIDRRKGLPVALSILYIHLGLAQGWTIEALNFPAHVICRIEKDGQRLLFDPFQSCRMMQAADLRQLLKTLVRSDAELSTEYYAASSRRELLIRLQNNIKLRQIEAEDYHSAVKTIERMRLLDPEEYRLMLDAGVLYARIGQGLAAIKALEGYINRASVDEKREALFILNQIRENLN